MKRTKTELKRMLKDDLIELILELQENNSEENQEDIFGNVSLHLKRVYEKYSSMANGRKRFVFNVKGNRNVLYINWRAYVPSGYGDNDIGGSFEYVLNDKEMKTISKKGFTNDVIKPMIESKCIVESGGMNQSCTNYLVV